MSKQQEFEYEEQAVPYKCTDPVCQMIFMLPVSRPIQYAQCPDVACGSKAEPHNEWEGPSFLKGGEIL